MRRENDNIISSPWVEQNARPRLLPDEFLEQLRENLEMITPIPQEIRTMSAIFGIGQKPVPGRYEAVTIMLYGIDEPIQAFCALLGATTTNLPVSIITLRYPLIVTLHNIRDQVSTLLQLISSFDIACQLSSRHVRQYQLLRQKLTSLAESCDEVIHLSHHLLDQAQFEERRLTQLPPLDEMGPDNVQTVDNDLAHNRIITLTSAHRRQSEA